MSELSDAEKSRNQAFIDGAEKTSNVKNLYIDSKVFASDDKEEQTRLFAEQLEAEVPGSAKAFKDMAGSNLDAVAEHFTKEGPVSLDTIEINGEVYCPINLPNRGLDERNEIVEGFTKGLPFDVPLENFKASDEFYNESIGKHEGEHCNADRDNHDFETSSILLDGHRNPAEEARADRAVVNDTDIIDDALDVFGLSDQHDGIREYNDLRALSSFSGEDSTHATGPFLDVGKENVRDEDFTMAKYYGKIMDGAVQEKLNGKSDLTPQEVLKDHHDAYFAVVDEALDKVQDDNTSKYEENPSDEKIEALISTQVVSDYKNQFETAYRRRVVGEDATDADPVQLLPKEVEDGYYSRKSASGNDDTLPGEDKTSTISPISAHYNEQVQVDESPAEATNDATVELEEDARLSDRLCK